jgi:putative ABC transport system permease protein
MAATRFHQTLRQDFGYAVRILRNNRGFAATAIFTLALGIGGNSAMFTVVRAVLLNPLPYANPDRLVRVSFDNPSQNTQDVGFSLARFEALGLPRSFTQFGAFFIATENMTLSGEAGPEPVKVARISANCLDILGVQPTLGRRFRPEEDAPGGRMVALISSELWRRRFASDSLVIGKPANLDATAYTIVGVLPPGFQFPMAGVHVWVTRPSDFSALPPPVRRTAGTLIGLGRLQPGVTLDQARTELNVLNRQYGLAHPEEPVGTSLRIAFLRDRLVANVRPILWTLFGAVGFVLLIACANLASLLLARATSRSREFAIRASLGANRTRLIGQLLAESVLLAFAGGALGLLLAGWILTAVTKSTIPFLPRTAEIHMDYRMLAFTLLLSIGTGILFGLFPALHASRLDLSNALRDRGEGSNTMLRRSTLDVSPLSLLVVLQIGLSMVLLIGAALLTESLAKLYGVGLGFRSDHLLTMQIALPRSRYDWKQQKAFFDRILERVETLPGVRGVAAAQTVPMTARYATNAAIAEQPPVKMSQRPSAALQTVTPDYFRTLGIARRRGRDFNQRDGTAEPYVIIVNESFARHFWPAFPSGPNPLGQHVLIGAGTKPLEIVAIVADVRERSVDAEGGPEIYLPFAYNPLQTAGLMVRTGGDPLRMVTAIRNQVIAVDRDQAVSSIQTMDHVIDASVGQRRTALALLALFAATALVLAVVGIYGVIAYSVAQRGSEIGIRCALGAQRGDILWMIEGQGLRLAMAGIVFGSAGAFALTRVIKALLFQVSATDPAAFVAVAALFLTVALLAAYVPARRAMRIDAASTLR